MDMGDHFSKAFYAILDRSCLASREYGDAKLPYTGLAGRETKMHRRVKLAQEIN